MGVSYFVDAGVYYLGLVDKFFDAGKPREGEVRVREYELHLWWSQCVHWDDEEDRWSAHGCELMQDSTYQMAKCRYKLQDGSTEKFHSFNPA